MGGAFFTTGRHPPASSTKRLAQQFLLGMVSPNRATALKSFRTTVASLLSNTFLLGGSVALSIHIVLTFFRMHGLALTLAFVASWLISVTAYLRWKEQQSKQRIVNQTPMHQSNSRKPAEPWRERQSA